MCKNKNGDILPPAIEAYMQKYYPQAVGSGFIKINSQDDERTHLYQYDAAGGLPKHHPDCWCYQYKDFDFSDDEPEPKNNDGRDKCYWCGGKTVTKPLATTNYQICEKCGK